MNWVIWQWPCGGIFCAVAPNGDTCTVSRREMLWGTLYSDTRNNYLQVPDNAPEFAHGNIAAIEAVRVWETEQAMQAHARQK